MSNDIKKTFWGNYDKKSIEKMMTDLSNELQATKTENAQIQQQAEKTENELKVKLANHEAEIEVKTKQINQLRKKIEDLEKDLQNEKAVNNDPKPGPNQENYLDKIGEIYSLAYDSAQKIVYNVKNSAEEFLKTFQEKTIRSQEQLTKLKATTIETKTTLLQRLEQIENQFMVIQNEFLSLSDEEDEAAETVEEFERFKKQIVEKLDEELNAFMTKNKAFYSPGVSETITSKELEPAEKSLLLNEKKREIPGLNDAVSNPNNAEGANSNKQENLFSTLEFPNKDASEPQNDKAEKDPSTVTQENTADSSVSPEGEKKPVLDGYSQEYINKKTVSVKDILKKYSNI